MSDKIIQLNEGVIKQELGEMVRATVERTINELLDQEADRLTNAKRYERSEGRVDTRAGSYDRKLLTKAGEVTLKVPKLRTLTFETSIIQRYQKREARYRQGLDLLTKSPPNTMKDKIFVGGDNDDGPTK